MVPGDNFRIGFEQVERTAIQFCKRADEENDKAEGLKQNIRDVLCCDDVIQGERSYHEDHAKQRQHYRQFVAHHLSYNT